MSEDHYMDGIPLDLQTWTMNATKERMEQLLAAEAVARDALWAVQMAYDHQTMALSAWWQKYGERGASEDYVLRAKTYKSVLDSPAARRLLASEGVLSDGQSGEGGDDGGDGV